MDPDPSEPSVRRQHRAEIQARALEEAFAGHGLPAEVRGGETGSGATTFIVEVPDQGFGRLPAAIEDRLKAALKVPAVRVQRERGCVVVEVENRPDAHVNLLELLADSEHWPFGYVALGRADDGRPLYLELFARRVSHLLLLGDPASGKSSLLRSIALSLAYTHRLSEVQMAFIDAAGGELHPLHYLPHAIYGVVEDVGECQQLLHFLSQEMAYRRDQGIARPAIVLFLDGLSPLIATGGANVEALVSRLLRRGGAAGIHLVVSARGLPSRAMSHALRAHVPTRLVGRLPDDGAALAASGVAGSHAEYLLGRGDFLAVSRTSCERFQAAYVDDYDLHLCLEILQRRRSAPVLARPFDVRQQLSPSGKDGDLPVQFSFDGERIVMWE